MEDVMIDILFYIVLAICVAAIFMGELRRS